MPKMECVVAGLTGTCGATLLHNFAEKGPSYHWNGREAPSLGGANLAIAGFIDNESCKKMYNQLAGKFNIAYQSSVRKNKNSGHQFFIVIYDGKKPKPKKAKSQPVVYNLNSES